MKNILLMVNTVQYNRGAEALARGTSKICKEAYKDSIISLVQAEDDFKDINIENIDYIYRKLNYSKNSLTRYIVGALRRIKCPTSILTHLKYSKLKKLCKHQDIIIVICGDNYDITYNLQKEMNILHTYLRKNTNAKMILYDCSIDKRDITDYVKKDLKNFDIVTARETITIDNIKDFIDEDKLYLYPDPAFVMDMEKTELPEIFKENKVVGINVSNLITDVKYGSKAEKILEAYENMIDYILKNTKKYIALIPHVMRNFDLSTLRKLYEKYTDNKRVYLIEDESLNAKQLKYIISKCDLYVGARTHSTIASYSTNVPTLVLGYSVKSIGIARDIFGTEKNYVLPVSNLKSDKYLVEGFKWLYENKGKIKRVLEDKMPKYKEDARKMKDTLKVLGENYDRNKQ